MGHSNLLSFEATDVGSWSFVSSNEPVKNGCEVIYEMLQWIACLESVAPVRGVMGSNPVEVLTFSGFFTQLLKLRS